jgi:hypothetical protein
MWYSDHCCGPRHLGRCQARRDGPTGRTMHAQSPLAPVAVRPSHARLRVQDGGAVMNTRVGDRVARIMRNLATGLLLIGTALASTSVAAAGISNEASALVRAEGNGHMATRYPVGTMNHVDSRVPCVHCRPDPGRMAPGVSPRT